jgi:uncharacterized protein DUF3800
MQTIELFLDEAGYTGPDLINRDQRVFTLASTNLAEAEARSLLSSCFGVRQGEVKYANLAKSQRGRAQIVDFVRALDCRRNCAFYSFHKEFVLLAYLIDFWLEPMMHEDGVNLYERGGNIALNNVSYLTLGTCLGLDSRRELLRQFQVMMRDRTRFAFDSFWDCLEKAIREHDLVGRALGALPVARSRLGFEHLVRLPAGLLDLGDYGLLETVQHWREKLPRADFVLVHDQSKFLQKQREFWESVLRPTNPTAVVGQDRRTIAFPLPVMGLRLEDSRHFPQLQVADLIASAARAHASGIVARSSDPFLDTLRDAGLMNALAGGVWPTAQVRPEELETDGPVLGDAAEFISRLVKPRSS